MLAKRVCKATLDRQNNEKLFKGSQQQHSYDYIVNIFFIIQYQDCVLTCYLTYSLANIYLSVTLCRELSSTGWTRACGQGWLKGEGMLLHIPTQNIEICFNGRTFR